MTASRKSYASLGILLACGMMQPSYANGSMERDSQNLQLVWSDEFEVDGRPDPEKWTFEKGFVRNGEHQWYQPENAFVANGLLVIEARRAKRQNPDFGNPAIAKPFRDRKSILYTSASITTKGLHSWKYGRFEIRAKIRAEEGLWPALWFVGDKGRWPANGEIDLMEYYDGSILANFAWASNNLSKPVWRAAKRRLSEITSDPDWDSKFHIWQMDWNEQKIVLSLDGQRLNEVDLNQVRNGPGAVVANPFRQPHFLLMNLALGGGKGGSLNDTKFPSRFEVDYVRIYQHKGASK